MTTSPILSPLRTEEEALVDLPRAGLLVDDVEAAALASAFAFLVASKAARRAGSVRWNVEALTRLILCVDLRLIQPSVGVAAVVEAPPDADVVVPEPDAAADPLVSALSVVLLVDAVAPGF